MYEVREPRTLCERAVDRTPSDAETLRDRRGANSARSCLICAASLLLGDLPQVSPVVRRLILRAVARTQAGMVWSEHGYLAWLAEQMPGMSLADQEFPARRELLQ